MLPARSVLPRAASALLALVLATSASAAYNVSAFVAVDAGGDHKFTNFTDPTATATGDLPLSAADTAFGGIQQARTQAYAAIGSMGGMVRASTGGALLQSAQGFDDLSWYADFVVQGLPGTQVSFLAATSLDGQIGASLSAPGGSYSGRIQHTTFVNGEVLGDFVADANRLGAIQAFASRVYTFDVGQTVRVNARLTVGARADIESAIEADAFNTGRFYLDVLTPGAGYLTDAGVVFAAVPVPEPPALLLMAVGALALGARARATNETRRPPP